jgi:replicative DNA helicase
MTPDLIAELPWAQVAEQSVLGALLQRNDAWDRVADLLDDRSFFASAHREIFATIGMLVNAGKPADVVTVFERLRSAGKDEDVGGLPYLTQLSNCVASAANIRRYAEIVAEKAIRRALMETADEVRTAAQEDGQATDIVDACVTKLLALQQTGQRSQVEGMDRIVMARMDHINALNEGTAAAGITTGLPGLDEALGGGLREGKLIVIAARPGVGKTASALQIAKHCAIELHQTSAVFSMEMEKGELADRCIANEGRIAYSALLTGKLSDSEWGKLSEAVHRLGNAPMHMDDQPALTLHDIRAKAAQLVRRGLRVLAIDYIQLCAGSKAAVSRRENRNSEIEEITRGLKQMAKEFRITVLLLSQLSREVEKRSTPKPTLSDLRDSGAIEQDADVVLMLWPMRQDGGNTIVGAYTPKNRQGKPNTEWQMKFQGYWQRFVPYEEETAHRGPSYTSGSGGFDN